MRALSRADQADQADFRLLDRKAVDALCKACEQAGRGRGLVQWIGFRQVALPYVPAQRAAGLGRFTLKQLTRVTRAGVHDSRSRPLRISRVLGGGLLLVAGVYAAVSLILWPMGLGAEVPWHLAMAVAGLVGVQLLTLALLRDHFGRILDQGKARPLYVIRRTLGFPARKPSGAAGEPSHAARTGDDKFSVFT